MTLTSYPVKYEIYDDAEPMAKVETQDEGAASVEITGWVSADTWPELAEAIRLALVEMKLGE